MFGLFELSLRRVFKTSKRRAPRARKQYANDLALKTLYDTLIYEFFPARTDLLSYTVDWSARRQKRTLGSCNILRRHISVAIELRDPDYHQWLEPLLYHELCHAVLGTSIATSRGKQLWHGAEFKTLERRNPRTAELDQWMRQGGFSQAVRRHRARAAARVRQGKTNAR